MTRVETAEIMTLLQSIYPDSFRGFSNEMMKARAALWASVFQDDPPKLVQAAVQAWIATDTKGFLPVPGQIKEQLAILRDNGGLSDQDAWELVIKALGNSSYGSVEEFAKLPTDVQRAVGSANMLRSWATIPYNELQTVIASNFKREYRSIVAQKKDFAKIPEAIKQIAAAPTTGQIEV